LTYFDQQYLILKNNNDGAGMSPALKLKNQRNKKTKGSKKFGEFYD
jgi:hypothetical protein